MLGLARRAASAASRCALVAAFCAAAQIGLHRDVHQIEHRRHGIGVGAELEEHLDGVGSVGRRGEHQRGVAFRRFARVGIRAVREEHLDCVRTAGGRCQHESRGARRGHGVHVGAACDQPVERRGAAPGGCHVQRCGTVDPGRGLDAGAGLQQDADHFRVALAGGPVQGGHAVALCGIDVRTTPQQCAHAGEISLAGGVGQRRSIRRGRERRRHPQCGDQHRRQRPSGGSQLHGDEGP